MSSEATSSDRSTRGRLLVAGPSLVDPNFARSVVFMIEHNEQGALGVILNRPSDISVADALAEMSGLGDRASTPPMVFLGGPVEPGSVLALGVVATPVSNDMFTPVLDEVGLVDLAALISEPDVDTRSLRVFAGHAGWGPGQLEGELEVGGWFVLDAAVPDLCTDEPENLWRSVLDRQEHTSVRMFARYPDDPSAN